MTNFQQLVTQRNARINEKVRNNFLPFDGWKKWGSWLRKLQLSTRALLKNL